MGYRVQLTAKQRGWE